MTKRIIGIDVARALAVIGMIIVNFKVVLGEKGESWLKPFANVFFGKAAALFVVLAGVGLALMTNTAVRTQ
ncbi:MAG: heparan-alpha-glucosaminide N-acetyltransferase domain-containing protein, partial [Bacteroidota bacterium]